MSSNSLNALSVSLGGHPGKADTVTAAEAIKQRLLNTLPSRALQHLAFIRLVDAHADTLYDKNVVRLAVARYELLWLPLYRDHCQSASGSVGRAAAMAPPLDIAFAMHCHLLNPKMCAQSSRRVLASFVSVYCKADQWRVTLWWRFWFWLRACGLPELVAHCYRACSRRCARAHERPRAVIGRAGTC